MFLISSLLATASLPPFVLKNAAEPGMTVPAIGLGTGSYSNDQPQNPTCWSCPNVTYTAVRSWLQAGGTRIDTALCYHTQDQIGRALKDAKVKSEDVFITSKVAECDGSAQGYKEVISQHAQNLKELQVDYVDLLLVHWPGPPKPGSTKDPACQTPDANGTWASCRVATWKGMLELMKMGAKGGARAVGVSNFEHAHLMDLHLAGLTMPSVNQIEFHPFWHEEDLLKLHAQLGIASNSYSPLGTNDFIKSKWNTSVFSDPTITKIAAASGISNAQVVLRWGLQKGVFANPRSKTPAHQLEDMAVGKASFKMLSAEDVAAIDAIHPHPRTPPVRKVCPDPLPIK